MGSPLGARVCFAAFNEPVPQTLHYRLRSPLAAGVCFPWRGGWVDKSRALWQLPLLLQPLPQTLLDRLGRLACC